MRNLRHSQKTADEIKSVMTTVGGKMRDGKNNKNRINFNAVKSRIESQFDNYSICFENKALEHINPRLSLTDGQIATVKISV